MQLRAFFGRHPRLAMWAALAAGMVIILLFAARNVGLLVGQWAALILATIALAGLCTWIVSWNGHDDDGEERPGPT